MILFREQQEEEENKATRSSPNWGATVRIQVNSECLVPMRDSRRHKLKQTSKVNN